MTRESENGRQLFVSYALAMSWQLAIAVLVPMIGFVELGKAVNEQTAGVLIGLTSAVIAVGFVMWRTVQAANRLPVPKLTEAQRRKIQKSYEEEDEE